MNKESKRQILRHTIQLLFLLLSLAFFAGIIFFALPYTIHNIKNSSCKILNFAIDISGNR